jgi:carbon monoxide dehydrogenase subunit G
MRMAGEQLVGAPRKAVWQALNDPAVLRAAIPGCQSLDADGPDRFAAVIEVKIGPIGARFKGAVGLSDIVANEGYTLTGEGSGGIAGSAKGRARVRLSDAPGGTLVSYEVEAEVGGRMAQLGGPIIDATAKQLAGKFFSRFGEVVSGQAPTAPASPASASSAPASPAPVAHKPAAGFPWGWATALVLAVIAGFLLGRSGAAQGWMVAVAALVVAALGAGYDAGRRAGGGR